MGLVIISIVATLPVLIPLLFVRDPNFAIRLSNVIAILMLFAAGFYYGKAIGGRPLRNGLTVASIGLIMVLFAIPRTAGWLAHWQELLGDKDQKISRPRQWYTGADEREYVPIAAR